MGILTATINVAGLHLSSSTGLDITKSAPSGEESVLNDLTVNISGTNGLGVIIGKNNAGKSKALTCIKDAGTVMSILTDNPKNRIEMRTPEGYLNDILMYTRLNLFVVCDRNGVIDRIGNSSRSAVYYKSRDFKSQSKVISELFNGQVSHQHDSLERAFTAFISQLQLIVKAHVNTAIVMPTNRHFNPDFQLRTVDKPWTENNPPEIGDWGLHVSNLRDEINQESWQKLQERFTSITEGLKIHIKGPGIAKRLMVEEPGADPRPLAECGDGLRDLVALLIYLTLGKEADILIEEPGTRLHPGAQRRLLHVLESEAEQRRVWLTTHDGVLANAYSAKTRLSVRRDGLRSVVHRVSTEEDLLKIRDELGFEARDVLFAEKIIYCEGSSDRVFFRSIIDEIQKKDATAGGTVICELGGTGVIYENKNGGLKAIIERVIAVSNNAKHIVVIDSDGKSTAQLENVKNTIRDLGVELKIINKVVTLEGLFMNATLIRRILDASHEMATEKERATGRPVREKFDEVTLSQQILEAISDAEHQKDIETNHLNKLWQSQNLRDYPKVTGAQIAAQFLRTDDPEVWQQIVEFFRHEVLGLQISAA